MKWMLFTDKLSGGVRAGKELYTFQIRLSYVCCLLDLTWLWTLCPTKTNVKCFKNQLNQTISRDCVKKMMRLLACKAGTKGVNGLCGLIP